MRFLRSERGYALVLTLLFLPVFVGVGPHPIYSHFFFCTNIGGEIKCCFQDLLKE